MKLEKGDVVIGQDGWVRHKDPERAVGTLAEQCGEMIGELYTGQHPGYPRWWRYRLAWEYMAEVRTWKTQQGALNALLRAYENALDE